MTVVKVRFYPFHAFSHIVIHCIVVSCSPMCLQYVAFLCYLIAVAKYGGRGFSLNLYFKLRKVQSGP